MKRQHQSQVDTSVDTSSAESVNRIKLEIGGRIKQARETLSLTQDALAALAEAKSKSGLQDNEAGKSMPGGQMISALVRAGINANWLLTGEGPMLLADLVASAPAARPAAPKINVDALAHAYAVTIQTAPKGETIAQSARKAVAFYQYCWDNGLITEDGEADGNLSSAA